MKKHELISIFISLVAIVLSVLSLYFQFYRNDKLIMRINPIQYNKDQGLVFDLAISNLGNASGMVKLNHLYIMDTNTKGQSLFINKENVVKPGEIEIVRFESHADPFAIIKNDNKKHKLLLNVSYVNSDAYSKTSNINIGFLCMSSSKKNIYTDLGYLPLKKLGDEKGGHLLTIEGNTITYGTPKFELTEIN